jgi:oligopeptide/dipeptide ABC transporter ATP-binding protein
LIAAVPVPDPARRGQRLALQGEPPSPLAPPPGCAFHPRCPRAQARCRSDDPAPQALPGGSVVRCHFPGA